jgi:hypothetical protein
MSKKQKLAETRRRIAELQTKLVSLKTAKPVTEKEARFNTGLARLIESELDKAGVVMAAQSIVDKLTKMIEDTAKVYGDEVVPMMDSIKDTFGPDMAENFRNAAQNQLNAATTALTQVKDAIGAEVSKLEGVINGGGSNDMGMADDLSDMAPPAGAPAMPDPAAAAIPPAPTDGVGGDMSTDPTHGDAPLGDTGEIPMDPGLDGMDDGSAAGRAKKESAKPKGKPVREGEFVLGKKGVNPFAKKDDAKKDDKKKDDAKKDDKASGDKKEKEKDAKNESARSKATKALSESSNPDQMILNAFKKALREGHSPVRAARAISKVFEVDFADVVEIVRESSLGK